jgi:hypothetical protein
MRIAMIKAQTSVLIVVANNVAANWLFVSLSIQ